MLQTLCLLAPEPIPVGMTNHFNSERDDRALKTKLSIANLAKYSLLKWSNSEHTFIEIHRLVQEMTEYQIPTEEKQPWLKRTLAMVDAFCKCDPTDVRTWKDVYTLANWHIEKIIHYAEMADIAEPTIRLMNAHALYLMTRAQFALAEPFFRRALVIGEKHSGHESIGRSRTADAAGFADRHVGRIGWFWREGWLLLCGRLNHLRILRLPAPNLRLPLGLLLALHFLGWQLQFSRCGSESLVQPPSSFAGPRCQELWITLVVSPTR